MLEISFFLSIVVFRLSSVVTAWCNNKFFYKPLFSRTVIFAFLDFCGNSRVVNFAIFLMLSLL